MKSAEEPMTGLYTCVAVNEVGIDKYDVLLLVTSCKHQLSGVTYRTQGEALVVVQNDRIHLYLNI